MSDTSEDWPEHRKELTRKATRTFEKWVEKHTEGKITDRELFIVTDALWDTISGLCDEALLRLLEATHEEIRQNAKRKRAA